MGKQLKLIGIFGGSQCNREEYELAQTVGRKLAREGCTIICGGGGGIMEAVCRGVTDENGLTIGILPGNVTSEANEFVKIPVATGLGIGRNIIIARSAQVCLALFGAYGTLSEIAYGLQLGKTVLCMGRWSKIEGVIPVTTPDEAVRKVLESLQK